MKKFTPTKEAYKLFHEGSIALSQIEANGVRVDLDYVDEAISKTKLKIKELTAQLKADPIFSTWKKRFGETTKLGSKPQMATVIFDIMGHPRNGEVTDTGDPTHDEKAFSEIDLPFVKTYFQTEKLKNSIATYLNGIRSEVIGDRVHPGFHLFGLISYRSSSKKPNFQNIPIRNPEMAKIIRQCYIPSEGNMIGEVDFSGIEVRISACYHKDPVLINYIIDPTTDMHRDMASQIFMLKPDQIDKKGPRDCAKNMFVFPSFYGSVWFQTAPDMWKSMFAREFKIKDTEILVSDHLAKKGIKELGDCTPGGSPKAGTFAHHVQQVEKDFWENRFRVYHNWKKSWYNSYLRDGGFQFYTGFVCQGIFKRNEVLNYAIQGSAFHCLLWCLVKIQKWLIKNKMKTKIVGEIHDSLVADIYPPELDRFLAKCKQVMTVDLPAHWDWINVPIDIEAELAPVGASWYEKKGVALP